MLRKAGNIAIILLLLAATGGLPVTRHYCGTAQMSFSIFSTPKACCGSGCDKCHNVFKFTKVNENFVAGSSINTPLLTDVVTLYTTFYIVLFDQLNISPTTDSFNQRAGLYRKAGHSPASFGNFRC